MEIEKTMWMNRLYDFYGNLLTEKQRDYLELYYVQDLSLSEISQELGVSRQAVYDNIKRSELLLEEYEEQLQMVAQFQLRQSAIKKLAQYVDVHYADDKQLKKIIQEIENGE